MQKYTLKNGTRIILTPLRGTEAVTILVLYSVGSRHETEDIAGISHFLEHMMFKGTTKRPDTLALSKELDQVGAQFNAYTSMDNTGYWIKVNSEHINLGLDMLSDMLHNSKLDKEEIDREKGTIIEEINMYEDTPKMNIENLIMEILFKGNSLARNVAGSKKTVSKTTRENMLKYWQKNYTPKNCVISIAGKININQVKKDIEKKFGDEVFNNKKNSFEKFKEFQTQPQIKLQYKKTEQVHLSFGFTGPKLADKDLMAVQLLGVILGGSMSSRLFINIRERHGLCYYIRASHDATQDTGMFNISAGLDKKRIFKAIELILEEVRKIKNQGITIEELKKAQEFLKGHLILGMEDSSSVADWYGRQELMLGKIKTPTEKIKLIMSVKKTALDAVAKKIFQTNKLNLALIGPFKNAQEFLKIIKI
ncbi:MAG TPA: pitrilysin family protein [bacterium]|nr:pitrilysin family protein [bacterium]